MKECSNPKPLDNYKHSQENSNNPVAQIVGGNLEPPDLENNKVKDEQGNLAEVCNNKDFDHTLENLNIAKKGTREGTASIERMLDNIEVRSLVDHIVKTKSCLFLLLLIWSLTPNFPGLS